MDTAATQEMGYEAQQIQILFCWKQALFERQLSPTYISIFVNGCIKLGVLVEEGKWHEPHTHEPCRLEIKLDCRCCHT